MAVTYRYEYDQRLRVALVGCGGQAFRNLLPSFQYAPITLVATVDVVSGRAARFAADFGAGAAYDDLGRMLAAEQPEAVFLATGYGDDHLPRYPAQAIQVMEAGSHVWMEKPPAGRVADIEAVRAASERTGRLVGVGLMKMFSPAVETVAEIMDRSEFGRPSSFFLRDPELVPAPDRRDPASMEWLLDHLPHPAAVIHRLMGPVDRLRVERAHNGAAFVTMTFASGAIGVLHMPWGQSGTSPSERLEVVGDGANVVVENNSRITYYRPGHRDGGAPYGRAARYTTPLDEAPLHWELNQYSGQPYNANVFVHGYAQEILHFTEQTLAGRPVRHGSLADAWHVTRLYEAVRDSRDGAIELGLPPAWTLPAPSDSEEVAAR